MPKKNKNKKNRHLQQTASSVHHEKKAGVHTFRLKGKIYEEFKLTLKKT